MKKSSALLLLFLTIGGYFLLTSGRCKSCITTTQPNPAVQEGDTQLVLYNTASMKWSSHRKSNYPCPSQPLIGQDTSAPSLSSNLGIKFYCVVTVECTGNTSWGSQGKKTFVWNSTSNTLNIKTPKNYQFKITVDFYEKCGNHYTDGSYGRDKWSASTGTTGYSSVIGLNNWPLVGKYPCN